MTDIVMTLIIMLVYFLPTLIALWAQNINTLAIFLLNLFLGWTGLGWIISIIWAVYRR